MNPERYGQAYQRGFTLTLRFLRSRGASPDLAREVAQTAWVKGWERLGQLRNDDLVTTWVNTIALNVYRRVRRKEAVYGELPDFAGRPGVDLAAIDVGRILRICCPGDRALLEQHIEGLTAREIAHVRGVPEGAIRVRLLRARRAARLRIQQTSAAVV